MALVDEWMPPELDPTVAAELIAAWPDDPHMAAALAWEAYAATTTAAAEVASVSTGVQSVTYRGTGNAALDRAAWHRRRAKVRSVRISRGASRVAFGLHGEQPEAARDVGTYPADVEYADTYDEDDQSVPVATVDSPALGG